MNKKESQNIRHDHELPESIEKWGWEFHHLGIPTNKKMPNEKYLPRFKFYISGFDTSPFGIEWMRFESDSPMDQLIQTVPHIAFKVKDLDYELANRDFHLIGEPDSTTNGIRIAMIEYHGAPIELIEFQKKNGQ